MNVVGIPVGLPPWEYQALLQRRHQNEHVLMSFFEGIQYVHLEGEPAARVHIMGPEVMIPSTMMNLPRPMFLATLDEMMAEAVIARTMLETPPPAPVKHVPASTGRQFFMTRKRLAELYSETEQPCCSICQEDLIPEGNARKKVWQLHGPQCTFHVGCLRRWFKESSKCPNCNQDCGV